MEQDPLSNTRNGILRLVERRELRPDGVVGEGHGEFRRHRENGTAVVCSREALAAPAQSDTISQATSHAGNISSSAVVVADACSILGSVAGMAGERSGAGKDVVGRRIYLPPF